MRKVLGFILVVGVLLVLLIQERQSRQAQGLAAGMAQIEVPKDSGAVVTVPDLNHWYGSEAVGKNSRPPLLDVPPGAHRVKVYYEYDYFVNQKEIYSEVSEPVVLTVNFVVGHRYRFEAYKCTCLALPATEPRRFKQPPVAARFSVEDAADRSVVAGDQTPCPNP